MKKIRVSLLALLLCVVVLFSGCEYGQVFQPQAEYTHFKDMVYTRPDMDFINNTLARSCRVAKSSSNIETTLDAIYDFYDVYDAFYTNYALADIYACQDMTSEHWNAESDFCVENAPVLEAGLEELFCALADSPIRDTLESPKFFGEGFFDAYENSDGWTDAYTALADREAELINTYYSLSADALSVELYSEEYYQTCGQELSQLLIDLVLVRQQMAQELGYKSYADMVYMNYYGRSYTPQQMVSYLQQVWQYLTPLYQETEDSDVWEQLNTPCEEEAVFAYVQSAAKNMGGVVWDAFSHMEEAGLYDIAYSDKKFDTSFETYLQTYYEPFIFLSPIGTNYDMLTFSHEFGHFVGDYACYGTSAGLDVTEVQSQAMEYLALCYQEGGPELTKAKMAASLAVYVEQSAFALFELGLYDLSPEELTHENLEKYFENVCLLFGMDSQVIWPQDYITISHLYIGPMYLSSYVVSNDVAMQIYQLELEEPGAGLKLYEECVYSQDYCIEDFISNHDLQSPFHRSRLDQVYDLFAEQLAS